MPSTTTPKSACVLVLLALVSLASTTTNAAPVAYPLKKSANGRHLVDGRGVPYMIVGDSPQALIVNISEADAEMYFADREAHGFNTVWINLLCGPYTGGRPDGSTIDGIVPFTGRLPSRTTYDLLTPNEAYFARVDRILRRAAAHGLQVILDPIETGEFLQTMLDNGAARCRDYGRYLGSRYRSFDNILWMSGNDFQDWRDSNSDTVVLEVARGILDNDTRHLHTLELDYLVSSSLDDTEWTSIVGLNATYTYAPSYARLLQDYDRVDFVPNFLVEANYEFESLQGPTTTAPILRKQEYWAMTSGATGQMYGNGYTWPFREGWQEHLDTPGANEMRYLVGLFGPRAWYELVPDRAHAILTDGYGAASSTGYVDDNDYATAAGTPDGTLVIAYVPTQRTLTMDLRKLATPLRARWFDPTSGAFTPIAGPNGGLFSNRGSHEFVSPGLNGGGAGDWVLVLEQPPQWTRPGRAKAQRRTGLP